MSDERSPRELKSLNEHKLTRRRVMKAAAAVGMSSAAALTMTPEDVKAADSDQVTIPFDTQGEEKKQISADVLDWYYRARDATDTIRESHFGKDGVHRVATRGGGPKDNAHVHVILNGEDSHADERRGELPEEENGVRVEVDTADTAETNDHCSPNCWSDMDNFPGGQKIRSIDENGEGTITPQHYQDDLGWFGWTTAAHVLIDCYTGQSIEHNVCSSPKGVGEVTGLDKKRDIAWITPEDGVGTSPLNYHPEHTESVEILGTLSEEGLVTIDEEDQSHFIYGTSSCKTTMNIEEWNGSHNKGEYCSSERIDQMYSGHEFAGGTEEGDSGALYTVEDPGVSGNYYAMGSHSGAGWFLFDPNNYGVQGFSIVNNHNRRWAN